MRDGYEEVIMQPLHMIPGEEFIYINKIAEAFKEKFEVSKGRKTNFLLSRNRGITTRLFIIY